MKKGKFKKILILLSLVILTLIPRVASANDKVEEEGNKLENTKIVTGTKALINDATKVLLIGIPILTVLLALYNFIKIQLAEEDVDVKPLKKRIKIIIAVGALAFAISGLISVIISYYQ